MVDLDLNELGLWTIGFECALEIRICIYHLRRDESWATIEDANEVTLIDVYSNERDLDHIRFHLPGPMLEVIEWSSGVTPASAPWRLLRQDDNGNRYEIRAFSSRCEAMDAARIFEERGHKQMYWVEGP